MKDYKKHIIDIHYSIREALIAMNELSGPVMVLFVVGSDQELQGTLTDGDIRRALIAGIDLSEKVENIINRDFHYLSENKVDVELIRKYKEEGLYSIPYLNSRNQILRIYDFKRQKTILPIDAVMMAGGRGARLRPLTDSVPKPLLKIGSKPIIDYNVDRLIEFGVDNIFVTVNYLAEQVMDHFNSKKQPNVSFFCVRETKPLGTIGSVQLIEGLKEDVTLIMNSDLFTNIDFEDFYLNFIQSEADMAIATIPYNVNVPYAIMSMEGDTVKAFKEKPTYTFYANAGIYLIKRELFSKIPANESYDATDFMQALIDEGYKVVKYPIMGYWVDIGRHEDFEKVQEFVKHIGKNPC